MRAALRRNGSAVALFIFLQRGGAFTNTLIKGNARVPQQRHVNTAVAAAAAHHIRAGRWSNLGRSQVLLSSATDAQESTGTLGGEPSTQQVRVRTGEGTT